MEISITEHYSCFQYDYRGNQENDISDIKNDEDKKFINIKSKNKSEIDKWLERTCVDITEESFYPPEDTRYLKSQVYDTDGDTFCDFTEEFNSLNDELEIYNDND